ncbi:hypothetical protein [Mycobacterium riyadhense]|uniref:hypothetical protein n=1 Tax=Mycobacterium riyadhense TaxID=486698 RepID=UPI00194F81E0|nr:hypothetical protein [Mycobacterium riyadhense]
MITKGHIQISDVVGVGGGVGRSNYGVVAVLSFVRADGHPRVDIALDSEELIAAADNKMTELRHAAIDGAELFRDLGINGAE